MSDITYFHRPVTIDTVGGNVVGGIGTGFLKVIFSQIDRRKKNIVLTVILSPNADLYLFSPVRAALG